MASLENNTIADTYPLLLKVDANGVDGTLRAVEGGEGTDTALKVSTGAVQVDNIKIDGNTISSTNTDGNIVLSPNGSGTVTANITGNVTGNVSGTAPAGTLTGSTLASGVTASSLQSVGTHTGLTVNGATVINENSADVDFRVESNDYANMFVVDGGTNQVGIGNGVASFSTGVLSITNTVSNDRADVVIDTFAAGGSSSALWLRASRNNTVGTLTETADGQSLGTIYVQGVDNYSSSNARDYGAYIDFLQSGDSAAKVPTDICFGTATSSAIAEKMRITSSGSVGIGTGASVATVSGATDLTIGNTTGAHGMTFISNSSSTSGIFFGEAVGTVTGRIEYDNNIQDMFFTCEGSKRMTINSTGVGIGTTNPGSALHVNEGGGGNNGIKLGEAGVSSGNIFSDGSIYMGIDGNNSVTAETFRIYHNGSISGNELFRVEDNGDVTLNTHVYGNNIGGDTHRALHIRSNEGLLGVDTSSERYKKKITDMSDTSWIYDLRPVDFEWKKTDKKDWGLIAEEVIKVKPELGGVENDLPEWINYERLIPILLKEIQEPNNRIEILENA